MEIIEHDFWGLVDKGIVLASASYYLCIACIGFALGMKQYALRVFLGVST
ncbi:hypothetical protein [Shewanella maritima]|nr:hypothetical protein [Shewanella maritima]